MYYKYKKKYVLDLSSYKPFSKNILQQQLSSFLLATEIIDFIEKPIENYMNYRKGKELYESILILAKL